MHKKLNSKKSGDKKKVVWRMCEMLLRNNLKISGHLSERMLIENNPWETAWKSAQPVPVSRQKRLFNETREAEKVLHYLASKSVGQAAELLLSTLIHAGLYTLSQAKDYSCGDLNWPNLLKPLFNRLQNVAKAMTPQMKHCEVFTQKKIFQFQFFKHFFTK